MLVPKINKTQIFQLFLLAAFAAFVIQCKKENPVSEVIKETINPVSYTHLDVYKRQVQDISTGGSGINFGSATADDAVHAMHRALHIYHENGLMDSLVHSNMNYDFSWEKSAEKYLDFYGR